MVLRGVPVPGPWRSVRTEGGRGPGRRWGLGVGLGDGDAGCWQGRQPGQQGSRVRARHRQQGRRGHGLTLPGREGSVYPVAPLLGPGRATAGWAGRLGLGRWAVVPHIWTAVAPERWRWRVVTGGATGRATGRPRSVSGTMLGTGCCCPAPTPLPWACAWAGSPAHMPGTGRRL